MRLAPVPFIARVAAVFVLSAAAAAQANGPTPARHFELINRAHDDVVAVSVVARGEPAAAALPRRTPLRAGGDSVTIPVAGAGCVYDFRFEFGNGQSRRYPDIDVCRYRSLRIGALRRSDRDSAR